MYFGVSLFLSCDLTSLPVGIKDLLMDGLYALRVGQELLLQSHLDSPGIKSKHITDLSQQAGKRLMDQSHS